MPLDLPNETADWEELATLAYGGAQHRNGSDASGQGHPGESDGAVQRHGESPSAEPQEDALARGVGGGAEQPAVTKQKEPYGRLRLRRLSEVASRSVAFVDDHKLIPRKAFTLVAGVGGLGKTTWATGIAARETRGEYDGAPHDVLYASYEDTAEEIWRPRILAAEGDPSRVIEVQVELNAGGVVVLPEDLDQLKHVIQDHHVRLVIIDPIIAAIDLRLDTFKDQHVRSVLGQLRKVAEDTDSAIVGIGHLNKAPSSEAYIRIANSVAFWNAARAVIIVTEEDDEHRLISQVKGNWSAGRAVQRWRMEPITLPDETDPSTGKGVETSRLVYVGFAEGVHAADVLQRRDDVAVKLTGAALFLHDALLDGEWHESAGLKKIAGAQGISERTLKRAAKELNVEYEKRDFPMTTWWRLPGRATPAGPTDSPDGDEEEATDRAIPGPHTAGPIGGAASETASQLEIATVGPGPAGGPAVAPPQSGQAPTPAGPIGPEGG